MTTTRDKRQSVIKKELPDFIGRCFPLAGTPEEQFQKAYARGRGDLADQVNLQLYPLETLSMHLEHLTNNSKGQGVGFSFSEMCAISSTISVTLSNIRRTMGLKSDT